MNLDDESEIVVNDDILLLEPTGKFPGEIRLPSKKTHNYPYLSIQAESQLNARCYPGKPFLLYNTLMLKNSA